MSPRARIAIIVAALVVLAGGFVLASGASDDDEKPQAGTTQSAPPSTVGETAPSEPENPAATAPAETSPAAPGPRVERIRIRDGRPAGDPQTLEYESGETVHLRFDSNKASEIHIHGYDKYVDVPAGGSARTRFEADAEGIFEIEEHGTGELLAKLQVTP